MDFVQHYGPWALVAGASDGVGKEFAGSLARNGLNLVLLARRQPLLDEVAAELEQRFGVATRTLAIDLAQADAADQVMAGLQGLEVGFFVHCAGADPHYRHFLENSLEAAESMLHRNCTVLTQLCHHLCGPMVARGRGAVVILGSGAGLAGTANMVVYSASKAFDMVFAEALWSELKPRGVDVLGLILGQTDTPALRRLLEQRGLGGPGRAIRGADTPQAVVQDALAHLTDGPTRFANKQLRWGARVLSVLSRNTLVTLMGKAAEKTMGK